MTANNNARKELINFIDKHAFDVIIHTSPDKFDGKDREKFEDIRRKTKNEQRKFHEDYTSAAAVKQNFLQNVRSRPAQKLDRELEHLGLPTLPQLKDDFQELCRKLGV